jgi:hypothetical protein
MSEVLVGLHNGDPDNERWKEVLAHGVLHELREDDLVHSVSFATERNARSEFLLLLRDLFDRSDGVCAMLAEFDFEHAEDKERRAYGTFHALLGEDGGKALIKQLRSGKVKRDEAGALRIMSEVLVGLHNGDPDNERWKGVLAHGVLHELRAEDMLLSYEFQFSDPRYRICSLLAELAQEGNQKKRKGENGVAVLSVQLEALSIEDLRGKVSQTAIARSKQARKKASEKHTAELVICGGRSRRPQRARSQ